VLHLFRVCTLPNRGDASKNYWDKSGEDVYELSYRAGEWARNAGILIHHRDTAVWEEQMQFLGSVSRAFAVN